MADKTRHDADPGGGDIEAYPQWIGVRSNPGRPKDTLTAETAGPLSWTRIQLAKVLEGQLLLLGTYLTSLPTTLLSSMIGMLKRG